MIVQTITDSGKLQFLEGKHKIRTTGGHSFKIALYTSSATLNSSTTDYTTTNEVSGTGYTAGGAALTISTTGVASGTAYASFNDVTWSAATFTARGALIYNTTTDGGTGTTDAIIVLDFGTDKTVSASNFRITFPTADQDSAIVRIG